MSVPAQPTDPRDRWLPWLIGAMSLLPLFACWHDLRELFWFGDDWDLIDQIDHYGFWSWVARPFAENYEPLFKLAWGGVLFGGGGSYALMLAAMWLTHALTVALVAKLLRAAGFSWFVTLFSCAAFGLAAIQVEMLVWSTQWSAGLATLFLVGAALVYFQTASWTWPRQLALAALVVASALSFSRGVLAGIALGAVAIFSGWIGGASRRPQWRLAALCLGPALIVTLVIAVFSHLHSGRFAGHTAEIFRFGSWYFALSPLHRWADIDSWGWRTTALLGCAKVALIVFAFARTRGTRRELLALLLLVELGNAVLLGLGRFHTEIEATISSRYQYSSLICTMPFLACALEALLDYLPDFDSLRRAAAIAAIVIGAWIAARHWPTNARQWSTDLGRTTRTLLFVDSHPPEKEAVPGIPAMSTARAKELVAKYHLH